MVFQDCHRRLRALKGGRGLPQSKTLRVFWRIGWRASVLECAHSSGALGTCAHF